MILSENITLNTNAKTNSNLLILGSPGTGKTRTIIANLCDENTRSIILLDPKGEVYDMTHNMMEKKGYEVKTVDFINPDKSPIRYNPLSYIHNYNDVLYIAHSIISSGKSVNSKADPFWDKASIMLLTALIAYLHDYCPSHQQTLKSVVKLLAAANIQGDTTYKTKLDLIFDELRERDSEAFALRQYVLFRNAAERTMRSILISLSSDLCTYMTPEMEQLLSEDTLDIRSVGRKRTVVYVRSSDIDRSKDVIVNILFHQFFNELYREADSNMLSHSLNVPVQFILDDLGTNLKLDRLDSILSGCRSRSIGCTVVLQSIGQLKQLYGEGYDAITNSCQSFLYLGGIDYATNDMFSKLTDLPISELLNKNEHECYVFIHGKKPVCDKKFQLEKHRNYHMVDDMRICDDEELERTA